MVNERGVLAAPSDDAVLGSSTFRLCETMYTADTIMMTRSTSTTSTMGVTLMPTISPFFPPRALSDAAMVRLPSVAARARRGELAQPRADRWGRGGGGHRRAARREGSARLEHRGDVLCQRGEIALDVADPLLDEVVGHDGRDRDEEADSRC